MGLGYGDEEVETLPPNGSDQPFAKGIRLRCSNGRPQDSDTEALQCRIQARREDGIAIMDDESVRMIERQKLSRPLGRGMRSHVRVENAPRTDPIATKTYRTRKEAVTETKKSQATMACARLRTKIVQRWPELPRGLPRSRYLPTVRGETRIPNFSDSSFAILSWPHVGFSRAIWVQQARARELGRNRRYCCILLEARKPDGKYQ